MNDGSNTFYFFACLSLWYFLLQHAKKVRLALQLTAIALLDYVDYCSINHCGDFDLNLQCGEVIK